MLHVFFREAPLRTRLLLLSVILLCCWVLSWIAGTIIIALAGYNINVFQNLESENLTKYIEVLQILQIVQSVGLFVIPPILFAMMVSEYPLRFLSLRQKPYWTGIFLSVSVLFFSIPFINFAGKLNSQLVLPPFMDGITNWMKDKENLAESISAAFINRPMSKLPVNLLMIALIPAIGEELLFRGVLQPEAIRITKNVHCGIWLTSVLFGALHLQFYTFLPRVILGSLFGYLLQYSRSLWYPIAAHFLNNTMAVLFAFFGNHSGAIQKIWEIGSGRSEILVVALSIILTLLTLRFFRKSVAQLRSYSIET